MRLLDVLFTDIVIEITPVVSGRHAVVVERALRCVAGHDSNVVPARRHSLAVRRRPIGRDARSVRHRRRRDVRRARRRLDVRRREHRHQLLRRAPLA